MKNALAKLGLTRALTLKIDDVIMTKEKTLALDY